MLIFVALVLIRLVSFCFYWWNNYFFNRLLLHNFIFIYLVTESAILFPNTSSVLWTDFLEEFFKESSPISNNCFSYFLVNDENPSLLTYFPVFGSIKHHAISIYKSAMSNQLSLLFLMGYHFDR